MYGKTLKTLTGYVKVAYFCVIVTSLLCGGFFLMSALDSPHWMIGALVAAVLAMFFTRVLALLAIVRIFSDRVLLMDVRPNPTRQYTVNLSDVEEVV